MKKLKIITVFLFSNLGAFAQEESNVVNYVSQINWGMFKGVPTNDTLGARIATSIYLEVSKTSIWNGTITFKAWAQMNPSLSWVRLGYVDDHTLQHEQTHFNITEVCARNLQAELNQLRIKLRKSPIITAVFTKWQTKMEALQKEYDLETKGGNDTAAQKRWQQRILLELQ